MFVCMHGLVQACICKSAIKTRCLSSLYMLLFWLFTFLCTSVLPPCIYVHNMCIPSAQEGHTTTLDLLKLVMHGCGITTCVLGIKSGSSVIATSVLNHQVVFLIISTSVLRQGLSLNPELTNWLHWLASKPWEPVCLCTALTLSTLSKCHQIQLFQVWRSTQVFYAPFNG